MNTPSKAEARESETFDPPPEGYEAILDDDGNDTGYRFEIATGLTVFFDDDEDGDDD